MSSLSPLSTFLAGLGPNFNASFIAEHLGSASLDDIIELTVDISDLQGLVQQGMKPVHKNKLWSAIVKERDVRCAEASNRVLLSDVVGKKLQQSIILPRHVTDLEKAVASRTPSCDGSLRNARAAADGFEDTTKMKTDVDVASEGSTFDGVLTDVRRAAAKELFQCIAGLLNSPDVAVRTSWENKTGSLAMIKASETWASEATAGVSSMTQINVMTTLTGLSNAILAGAIPTQGHLVLLGLHTHLMKLEYGLSLNENGVWHLARRAFLASLSDSLDRLASEIDCGKLPAGVLAKLHEQLAAYAVADFGLSEAKVPVGKSILLKLVERLCPRCMLTPCIFLKCQKCNAGSKSMGWAASKCMECLSGKPLCLSCVSDNQDSKKNQEDLRVAALAARQQEANEKALAEKKRGDQKGKGKGQGNGKGKERSFVAEGPPTEGVTIERAAASDLALMQKFWKERNGSGEVVEAWSIDNPLRTYKFNERRKELQEQLGRLPDELEGLHGSDPNNYISIVSGGFRTDLRGSAVGQVYGSGEYLAKCPDVSVGYCRGGHYMLVCRLALGLESSTQANLDGDHIWVPSCNYYVISRPEQILPIFIVKFQSPRSYGRLPLVSVELEKALSAGVWSTKQEEMRRELPRPRPCFMSRPFAKGLWLGLMYAHHSDAQLELDVRAFLRRYARAYTADMKVQIVRGHFKKAHAILTKPIPKDLVHRLNTLPFQENGIEHNICVEDMEGSPEQKCPKLVANYCRGQNLRYTQPCWCWHPRQLTDSARYTLESVDLQGAKGNEIAGKFMSTSPFHDGNPRVVSIKAIKNDVLVRLHEEFRQYLANRHREEPKVRELYHGTNNNILDVLYQHGCKPPSDIQASEACPVSGGKGLCTTLCNNDCKYCTEKHELNRCNQFSLGIYLADMAQKSHRYVSQPRMVKGRMQYRMIVCSVLGRAFKVEGHLKCKDAMHDVAQVRALSVEDIDTMIEPCSVPGSASADVAIDISAEKSDMIFVQGLEGRTRPGLSVVNSEYIAFHPHQCLPKYEITYEL